MSGSAYYPLFLKLRRCRVLIVGGGEVARRKAAGLVDAGALVTVVSLLFDPEFDRMKGVTKRRAAYAPGHVAGGRWRLIFAATDRHAVNARVYRDAKAAGIWCCRCDEPGRGDFVNGAVTRLGNVTLAVSSGGASPVLAGRLQEQAAEGMDRVLVELAGLHQGWRDRIKQAVTEQSSRARLLRRLAGREMETCLRRKGVREAEKLFARWLAAASPKRKAHAG